MLSFKINRDRMVLNLWKISSKKVQRSITTKTEEIELLKICESAYTNDNA